MQSAKAWRRSFLLALLALLISFGAAMTATFAWYIYNANAHTTRIRMAAGATNILEISNAPREGYSTTIPLVSVSGRLNPVSTNNLLRGFRKVYGFTNAEDTRLVARLFHTAEDKDFYCTRLYLRSKNEAMEVYVSGLEFKDSDEDNPISSAIRLGLVVHEAGEVVEIPGTEAGMDGYEGAQYIFDINPNRHVAEPLYNTYAGVPGHVLDLNSENTDATAAFTPLTPAAYAKYDGNTGFASADEQSVKICDLREGAENFVQVDLYIWVEGCDPDCTGAIASTQGRDSTLKDIAISFVGIQSGG